MSFIRPDAFYPSKPVLASSVSRPQPNAPTYCFLCITAPYGVDLASRLIGLIKTKYIADLSDFGIAKSSLSRHVDRLAQGGRYGKQSATNRQHGLQKSVVPGMVRLCIWA